MKTFILAAVLIVTGTTAQAATLCQPIDNTARVLASDNPNDIHPDWNGENSLGTSWSLIPAKTLKGGAHGIKMYMGNLYSPRGGLINIHVFAIAKEWDCQKWDGKLDANGNIPMDGR